MFMFEPELRRRELFLRGLTYFLMTLSVLTVLVVALFYILGFSIDKKTGEPVQGGLLQFRSFPTGATVSLNGKAIESKTPAKLNTTAGNYFVKMKLSKYREWIKQTNLKAGEVLWLNSLLIPSSIRTDEVLSFPELASTLFSPDRKWLALQEKLSEPQIKIIDLRDEKNSKVSDLPIKSDLISDPKPSDIYKVIEWNFGARYLLVKRVNEGRTSWLRLDRSDEDNAKNITELLGADITELHFSGNSGNIFFGTLSDGTLRKLDISAKNISSPISSNVTEFQLYKENKLSFISKSDTEQTASIYTDGDKNPFIVKRVKDLSTTLHINRVEYFRDDIVAVSVGRNFELIRSPDKTSKKVYYKNVLKDVPQWIFFSNSGQFFAAQTGNQLGTYDLERKQAFEFTIPNSTSQYSRPDHLQWLNDFSFWNDNGGKLFFFEFDGSNQQDIGTVTPGLDVKLSDNGKRLFSFGVNNSNKQPVLQNSIMVLE